MWGIKSAPLPGEAAAQEIFKGFAGLSEDERRLVAEILVRLAPGLAAQGDKAQRLPISKIGATLKAAFQAAWMGILKPSKLANDLAVALETAPEGAELRTYAARVSEQCKAAAVAVAPEIAP